MKKLNFLLILSVGLAPNVFCAKKDTMPNELSNAIMKGDLKKVKSLEAHLQKKQDEMLGGGSALHLAAAFGHLPLIKYLVEEKNFDVNEGNVQGSTPLLLLVASVFPGRTPEKLLELVKYFISKGADMNKRNRAVHGGKVYQAITPLDVLCQAGNENIIRYIIETKGEEITSENIDSSIKALGERLKPLEKALEATREALEDFKRKSPKILKMLNDLKAGRARS